MANQAPTKSSLLYLYIGSEWSGPFQVEQIRFFRHHGQVESDTYAYDPDQQRHYTVGELLASIQAPDHAPLGEDLDDLELGKGGNNQLMSQELDEAATPSTTRIFLASEESEATSTLGTSLDALPDPLRTFFQAFRELTEGRPTDREQVLAHLDETASAIGIQLSAATNDPESLTLLVGDLLRLADYLANRHQDNDLWEAVDSLRSLKPETDADDSVLAARQVMSLLVTKARAGRITRTDRHTPGLLATVAAPPAAFATARSTARDVHPEGATQPTDTGVHKPISESWDQPHARTARIIMRDARKELRSTEADLEAIQQAYTQLQEQHTRDLGEAQDMLASLESSRADEVANAAQALAEVRSLAAEIHRLAEENLSSEPDLQADIRNLADELKGQDATAMAPLAEGLLIRLVARLRNLSPATALSGGEPSADIGKDIVALREELAKSRSDLVQARAQAMVLSDERDRLRRQLDEQRGAADRAIASAKEREQRLRSTVTALEVTKDLHQDVMRELDVQLQTAQRRVGEMENELSVVRGDLVNTRSNLAERTRELQDEMRRAVELQAMLEARRAELSLNLKDAEAQLQQAQAEQATPGATSDPELMEALAVKVNHLRTMFEATKRRLDEQQQVAAKLEEDLTNSRREALDLRTRSDSLTGELDEARVGLASAKKRFEELHRANARLESERESLQLELVTRKGTDTLRRERDPASGTGSQDKPTELSRQSSTNRMSKVMEHLENKLQETNRRLEQATAQLDNERRRVNEINEIQAQLQVRVEDLTADRDQLRAELDRLHSDHFADHSRHAAAFASATQSTIEAERRLKEATLRVVELEGQVAFLQQHQEVPGAALQQLDAEGEDHSGAHFIPTEQVAELSRQLDEARAELAALKADSSTDVADQRAVLSSRLGLVEGELASATASRDDAGAQLKAAIAERDRFNRELLRLKNEHESAAVEHRVSLKSARDKLAESQARVQLLEKELDQQRGGEARARELTVERDRLNVEVHSLSARIERNQVSAELPEVKRLLEKEQDRIRTLTRSLSDAQEQADAARAKVVEMEARTGSAQHERDQLNLVIERLKGELLAAQAQAGGSSERDSGHRERLERRLQDVLTDREQLLSELSRVNGELLQVRGRLVRAESEVIAAERLPRERSAVLDLERQVVMFRNDAQAANAQLAEVRGQLGQLSAERTQLQGEVARLQRLLDRAGGIDRGGAELATLRERLLRAKFRIRTLRKEREDLLAQLDRARSAAVVPRSTASRASQLEHTPGLRGEVRSKDPRPAEPRAAEPRSTESRSTESRSAEPRSTSPRAALAAEPVVQSDFEDEFLDNDEVSEDQAAESRLPKSDDAPARGTTFVVRKEHNQRNEGRAQDARRAGASRIGVPAMPVGGFTSAFGRPSIPLPPSAMGRVQNSGFPPEYFGVPPTAAAPGAGYGPVRTPLFAFNRRWLHLALVVGGCGVAGALMALSLRPETVHGQITADLKRITSPIAGQVQLAVTNGELVGAGGTLGTVRNDRIDHSQFDALSARRQALIARQAATQAELDQIQTGGVEPDPLRQADRITRLQDLERVSSDTAERLVSLARETVAEERRIADLSERILTAERPQQVRRLLAAADGRIAAGTELMELVDPASIETSAELAAGSRAVVGDIVAITVLSGGPSGDGTITAVEDSAGGGHKVRIAVPIEMRQGTLVNARTRLAILGKEPSRLDRLGERLWRILQP